MKLTLLIILITILQGCSSVYKKPKNCERFRTGSFIQYDHENNLTIRYTRTDTLQTEYNLSDTNKYISRVVWLNNCDYDLYRIHADNSFPLLDSIKGNRPTHVSIIETGDDYYVFTVRIDGFDRAYSDTMFKSK